MSYNFLFSGRRMGKTTAICKAAKGFNRPFLVDTEAVGNELIKLQVQIEKYKEALKIFSDAVDESLLLDEQLSEDWDKLSKLVIEARKILNNQKE